MKYLQGRNDKRLPLVAAAVLMGAGIWLSRGLGPVQVWLYGLGMLGLVGIAAEGFLRRPADGESGWDATALTPWLVASLLVGSALWSTQVLPGDWLVQISLAGAVVAVILIFSLGEAANPESRYGRYGRFTANLLIFLLVFLLFALIYQTKQRASITSPLAGLVALVASLELLRSDMERRLSRELLILAGTIALVIAETTWLLNYWPVGGMVGGALLLLCFYVLVGLLQCIRDGDLGRSTVLEYGAVGAIGFLAILVIVP